MLAHVGLVVMSTTPGGIPALNSGPSTRVPALGPIAGPFGLGIRVRVLTLLQLGDGAHESTHRARCGPRQAYA